jgi:2-iminobutanoate/2-iminopropanoate deaminase
MMKMKRAIQTTLAPAAIGPYAQAVDTGDMLFVSGQLPLDPISMTLAMGIQNQTQQSLNNIEQIVKAAGYDLQDIVKCTVYLKNMNDFPLMNETYQHFFGSHKPARAAVEVARLPKDALIEIDCIAKR